MSDTIDFRQHLKRQLAFLEASSAAFDTGFTDEAYRLAVAMRVLLHSTKKSISLLRHLQSERIPLLSTTVPAGPNVIFFDGMSLIAVESGKASVRAPLDNTPIRRFVPATVWWNENVYVANKTRLQRRSIVLNAANQDGGAHVDKKLDKEYAQFKKGIWTFDGPVANNADVPEPHLTFLRQMAYELINSPALSDLASLGFVKEENLALTPENVSVPLITGTNTGRMTLDEVNRLRSIVRNGHFTLLDNLYRSSEGSAVNPLGNYQIDQRAGFQYSIGYWLAPLLAERLIIMSSPFNWTCQITPTGRAFVSKIIEIGH